MYTPYIFGEMVHTIFSREDKHMYQYLPITDVYAREILDSRGNPTVEVEVLAGEKIYGRASVPSGASTGQFEAVELRDKGSRYHGLGVQMAVDHVNTKIAPEIIGMNVFEQVEIETVYIEENKSSHFRAVRDSLRIYGLILKYLFSSASAAIIDTVVFYILKRWAILSFLPMPLTYSATIGARIISSLVNYGINAKHVFKEDATTKTFVKYYILAVVQLLVSATLVFVIEHVLQITSPFLATVAKAVIDTILFFFSFRIQHKWVFNNKK